MSFDGPKLFQPPKIVRTCAKQAPRRHRVTQHQHAASYSPARTKICQPSRKLKLKSCYSINSMAIDATFVQPHCPTTKLALAFAVMDNITATYTIIQSGQLDTGHTFHILMHHKRYASCSGTRSFDRNRASLRCPSANAIENGV